MSDGDLAASLAAALVTERDARAHWQAAPTLAEREAALTVVRLVTPVIRSLEQWITARALRAAQEEAVMAAGKHGSSEVTVTLDDAQGGTPRAITPYVTSIGGMKITALTQPTTVFGDTWVRNSPTGLKKAEPIPISGFLDDTASVGSHTVLQSPDTTIYDGTTTTSRTLTIVVGNSKTFTVECILTDYTAQPKNGNLTEYTATLLPVTSAAWT